MSLNIFKTLFLFFSVVYYVNCYPNAVPNDDLTCLSMKPKHGPEGQSTISPFTIITKTNSVARGAIIEVSLLGNGKGFKGFFLQARDSRGVLSLGEFLPGQLYKSNQCGNMPNNVAHHINSRKKDLVKLLWKAPSNFNGQITFTCTFVVDYNTFWVQQRAAANINVI